MENGKRRIPLRGSNILRSPFYTLHLNVRSVSVPKELGAFVDESVARAAANMIGDAIIVRFLPNSTAAKAD